MPHTPMSHSGDPLATEGHFVPHAPQLAVLVCRLASQPLVMLLSQLSKFKSQEIEQVLPEQDGEPLLALQG